MAATVPPPAPPASAAAPARLARADGVELLGPLDGSGHKAGAALVRRADGQVLQLGPLQYALLECVDGERDNPALVSALSERLGRQVEGEHVVALARKLAAQGLLAGTEDQAPPKRNPLLALRWKVLVTDPRLTRRLTAPFTLLFRPWLAVPILALFTATLYFVLVEHGIASATRSAFADPEMLLLVFALAVGSAGFHELGHAAAARYGGATPGGMGVGLYLVWPAFYTDVTDAYRLPRRDRLRVDLGGLHFNAVVAVATMGVWLVWRHDALLLLVGLQVLQMVKQLSPVIRADGYHVLADLTGVPDLYAHIVPTLKRLLPGGRKEPSALTGRARALVTGWVLVVVPVLLSLSLSAILLLPKLAATAWASGRGIATDLPDQVADGAVLDALVSGFRLIALALPVLGTMLVTHKVVRDGVGKARAWSAGSRSRRAAATAAGAAIVGLLAWAWWPAGQYQQIRATSGGTILDIGDLVASPGAAVRPPQSPPAYHLPPGRHLAVAMVPRGGASKRHPAVFVVRGDDDRPAVAILSTTAKPVARPAGGPTPAASAGAPAASATLPAASSTPRAATAPAAGGATPAVTFPFRLPAAPRPGDTQALAVGTKDGAVTYDVAYAVVTVKDGDPVTNANSAFAIGNCKACTTIAVSFQVVLVVGSSKTIAPVNAAGALNVDCPECLTAAFARQFVVSLDEAPSDELLQRLNDRLRELDALPASADATDPAAIAAELERIKQAIDQELDDAGAREPASTTATTSSQTTTAPATTTTTSTAPATPTTTAPAATAPATTTTTQTTPSPPTTTTTTTGTATAPTTSTQTAPPPTTTPTTETTTSTATG